MTRSAHTWLTAWWDETWPCTNAHHHTLVYPWGWKEPWCTLARSLSWHLGIMATDGTRGYGIHGYSIIPYLHPGHHPGDSAGELEQENQQCQCWLWMEGKHQGQISQTSTEPSSQHVQVSRSRALQLSCNAGTNCKQKLPLHFQQCLHNASAEDMQSKLESAGENRTERGGSSWETE